MPGTIAETYPDKGYPTVLADLALVIHGVGPFVDDRDLKDGWGNPFRYALVANPAGELEPHIWAEVTRNGRTILYGAKVAADGTIVRFGPRED